MGFAQIICENGKLRIQGAVDKKTQFLEEITPEKDERLYHRMLENFRDVILKGEPLIAQGTEGINSLMMSNEMYLSSWQRRMARLPIDGEAFWRNCRRG